MDQEAIKVDGHYVVPLPLKSKDVNLPNNRVLIKTLNSLHRRFLKDNHFYEMYKTLIADMIAKGYARKADNNGKSGKTWYIPHDGVVLPANPGKVRVVFDCSAKYITHQPADIRARPNQCWCTDKIQRRKKCYH